MKRGLLLLTVVSCSWGVALADPIEPLLINTD